MSNYLRDAAEDASETVRNFADEILEKLLDSGKASDDLFNDYPNGDAWHHECHVDNRCYSLTEAAELLDELYDFEETDRGLWESLTPREAIGCQAAYTYGNAVLSEWNDLIEKINEEASDIFDEYDERITEAEVAEEEREAKIGENAEDTEDTEDTKDTKDTDLITLEEERKEALRNMIEEIAEKG